MIGRRDLLLRLAGAPLASVAGVAGVTSSAPAAALHEYTINTPAGRRVSGALAMPLGMPAPTVVLIHDRTGLDRHMRAVAAGFAAEGYLALAVDLMDGRVAGSPDEARAMGAAVDPDAALDTLAGWIEWLGVHDASTHRIAVLGWGAGGAWALAASIAAPVDATILYYAPLARPVGDLARLKGPVMGHFASRDPSVGRDMVSDWEMAMDAAGKRYVTYWYEAARGFADPSAAGWNAAAAALARQRTLVFIDTAL